MCLCLSFLLGKSDQTHASCMNNGNFLFLWALREQQERQNRVANAPSAECCVLIDPILGGVWWAVDAAVVVGLGFLPARERG